MRIITVVSVIGIVLADVVGAIPRSSVGGPLTLLLMFFLAMLAVGLHEAWSNKRGVLGWIVSIVCSVIGGFAALSIGGLVMEEILPRLGLNGPLATSQHPMRYISPAIMMVVTLLGAWAALQLVNRFRRSIIGQHPRRPPYTQA
jgi:hypothetical protein